MAGEDRKYSDWIRRQPCAMCGTREGIEQHHKSGAGMGLRSHDWYSMPLCHNCHHVRLGEMPKEQRREFEFNAALGHRERYMQETQGTTCTPDRRGKVEEAF